MSELVQSRIRQARESLEEAKAIFEAGMDHGIVLTSLYYAFYYPIIALVYDCKVPETMQSVTLGLFDQQFIKTGIFKKEHADAIRQIFEIKPKCSGACPPVSREEIDRLLGQAGKFIADVEASVGSK